MAVACHDLALPPCKVGLHLRRGEGTGALGVADDEPIFDVQVVVSCRVAGLGQFDEVNDGVRCTCVTFTSVGDPAGV